MDSEPSRWGSFVANRTAIIQALSSPTEWRHVPSSLNPADLVSRGLFPYELQNNSLWWNGPNFLTCEEVLWPLLKGVSPSDEALLESKSKVTHVHVAVSSNAAIEYWANYFSIFSSLIKLQRTLAFMFRFIQIIYLL